MPDNYHAIENLPNMPVLEALKQPPDVWLCVEDEAQRHWPMRCKEVAGIPVGPYPFPDGWLKPEMFETLLALDVPILRLFWGCALKHKVMP